MEILLTMIAYETKMAWKYNGHPAESFELVFFVMSQVKRSLYKHVGFIFKLVQDYHTMNTAARWETALAGNILDIYMWSNLTKPAYPGTLHCEKMAEDILDANSAKMRH